MKKLVILNVGVLVLLLYASAAFSQVGGSKDVNAQGGTGVVNPPRLDLADANNRGQQQKGQAAPTEPSERERLREAARQRMRERLQQRRETQGDANAPGRPAPPFVRDRARGGEKPEVKPTDKSPDLRQQLEAAEQQVAHEEGKHLHRTAKLERIREIAQQEGDAKVIERVDKLMQKEKQRYNVRKQRAEMRKERVARFIQASSEPNAPGLHQPPRLIADPNEQ